MAQTRISHIGILCLALLIGGGALAVRAGDNQPAAPVVAVVDMQRIFASSDAPQKLSQQAAVIGAQADERIKNVAAGAYLAQKEGLEYIQLLAKAMPTEAEQARIKELRELSDSRGKRLQELVAKTPLNEDEKKELGDLTARQRNMEAILPRIQEELQADASARIEGVRRELINQLRTTVGQVAKEKGVTQVFSSEALVYAATDLTPQVIQKVKK